MISFKKITKENLKSIIDLKVSKHQKSQVAPNFFSIAQGHYSNSAWFRGIFLDNKAIGFVMLDLLQEENNSNCTVEYLHSGNFTDLRNNYFKAAYPKKYSQVFMQKHGFIPNLSILDLLFNL